MPMEGICRNPLTSKFPRVVCNAKALMENFSLLDISGDDQGSNAITSDTPYTAQTTQADTFANMQPTPTGVPSNDTH